MEKINWEDLKIKNYALLPIQSSFSLRKIIKFSKKMNSYIKTIFFIEKQFGTSFSEANNCYIPPNLLLLRHLTWLLRKPCACLWLLLRLLLLLSSAFLKLLLCSLLLLATRFHCQRNTSTTGPCPLLIMLWRRWCLLLLLLAVLCPRSDGHKIRVRGFAAGCAHGQTETVLAAAAELKLE